MGIVNEYMVKNAVAKANGLTVDLEADPGQSFLVKDIMIGGNDCLYADITIDKAMVGRFRTAKTLGSHLSFPYGMCTPLDEPAIFKLRPTKTILEYLGDKDIFKGFPIAEGQKMVISPLTSGTKLKDVSIIYEEYEGGDITSEMENGSESAEYLIINYGDAGGAISAVGTHLINTQNSPTEFPQFPFAKVVPAKTEIDVIGILASDAFDDADATNKSYTTYLKLVKERTVLFDDDRNGLLFKGGDARVQDNVTHYGLGNSKIGNYSDVDIKRPFMFPKPITFGAGEELNIYTTVAHYGTGGALVQADSEIGLIMKIRRVS